MRLAPPLLMIMLAFGGAAPSVAQSCSRTDFEAVVSEAAENLRGLVQQSTPVFQDKLRALKDKRGWTHDQFMAAAAPLVQDERIVEFDQKSADLLEHINSQGAEGASAKAPDCTMLAQLKAAMQQLVDTQKQKWAYMFRKLDDELAR